MSNLAWVNLMWTNRWSPSIKSVRVAIANGVWRDLDDVIVMTDSPTPELPDDSDEPDFDNDDDGGFDEADFGWDEDDE